MTPTAQIPNASSAYCSSTPANRHFSFPCPSPHLPATALRPPLPVGRSQWEENTDKRLGRRRQKVEECIAQLLYLFAAWLCVSRWRRIWVNVWTLAGAPGTRATASRLGSRVWDWRVRAGMSHPPAMCVRSLCWQAVSQHTHKHRVGVSMGTLPGGAYIHRQLDTVVIHSHMDELVFTDKHKYTDTQYLQSSTSVCPRKLTHAVPSGAENRNLSSTAAV